MQSGLQHRLSRYEQSPIMCEMKANFYVDDSSADREEEAVEMLREVYAVMEAAGMKLSKGRSNSSVLVSEQGSGAGDEDAKVSGVTWRPDDDAMSHRILVCQSGSSYSCDAAVAISAEPNGEIGPLSYRLHLLLCVYSRNYRMGSWTGMRLSQINVLICSRNVTRLFPGRDGRVQSTKMCSGRCLKAKAVLQRHVQQLSHSVVLMKVRDIKNRLRYCMS